MLLKRSDRGIKVAAHITYKDSSKTSVPLVVAHSARNQSSSVREIYGTIFTRSGTSGCSGALKKVRDRERDTHTHQQREGDRERERHNNRKTETETKTETKRRRKHVTVCQPNVIPVFACMCVCVWCVCVPCRSLPPSETDG